MALIMTYSVRIKVTGLLFNLASSVPPVTVRSFSQAAPSGRLI